MLGLHIVPNKILHIDIWQGFEYALNSEYVSVTQGFCSKGHIIHVWQNFEYSSDSQYARVWIYKGCECVKVTQGYVQTVF